MISPVFGFFQSSGPTIFFLFLSPKTKLAFVNLISVSSRISPPVNNSSGINLSFALEVIGDFTGMGYELANIVIFVIIQPGLILLFYMLWRNEKRKNK